MKLLEMFRGTRCKHVHTSDGIIESLLGEVACLIGRVQDLVVKDGEVQSKTKTDGVRRR